MLFTPNSDLTSECHSRNQDLSDWQCFSDPLLSNFGESVWIVASASYS